MKYCPVYFCDVHYILNMGYLWVKRMIVVKRKYILFDACPWIHGRMDAHTNTPSHTHTQTHRYTHVRMQPHTLFVWRRRDWWDITHVLTRKVATLDSVPRRNVQSLNWRFEILCALLYTAKTHTHTRTLAHTHIQHTHTYIHTHAHIHAHPHQCIYSDPRTSE